MKNKTLKKTRKLSQYKQTAPRLKAVSAINQTAMQYDQSMISIVPTNLIQCRAVSNMWVESKEWTKLGGNAFFCFTEFGFLEKKRARGTDIKYWTC